MLRMLHYLGLWALLVSCERSAPAPPRPFVSPQVSSPADAFGPLKLGMTKAEVRAVTGVTSAEDCGDACGANEIKRALYVDTTHGHPWRFRDGHDLAPDSASYDTYLECSFVDDSLFGLLMSLERMPDSRALEWRSRLTKQYGPPTKLIEDSLDSLAKSIWMIGTTQVWMLVALKPRPDPNGASVYGTSFRVIDTRLQRKVSPVVESH